MTSPAKLDEHKQAEEPASLLLEELGWTCVARDTLAAERGDEGDVTMEARTGGDPELGRALSDANVIRAAVQALQSCRRTGCCGSPESAAS